jgi:ABC-2 type transport system permease protein
MTVFTWALKDRRRSLVGWSIGIVALVLTAVSIFPSVRGQTDFDDMVAELPAAVRALFGAQADIPFSSAPGYLHARLTSSLLPLLLLVFAIGAGARAIGGHEEDGLVEPVLAGPVRRSTLAIQRMGAAAALTVALAVVALVSTLALAPLFGALDGVAVSDLTGAVAMGAALALLHGGVAAGVGAMRGRRSPAVAAATVVAVGGYLGQALLSTSSELAGVRWLSPWHWLLGTNPLVAGADWTGIVVPVLVGVAAAAGGGVVFTRRDLR